MDHHDANRPQAAGFTEVSTPLYADPRRQTVAKPLLDLEGLRSPSVVGDSGS